ncbi:MAG: CotH kinase family protein, partial [Bacteroidales bacterium]|nr:CotH kinase family protein [Candidatus Scybalocola fimicaballi]
SLSAEANAKLWGSSNLSNEASSLTSWIKKRYAWLSSVNDVISKCAKADKATSDNELKSFSIKKSSNESALFKDYYATIENDSIKIFVPYLVHFNLQADFTVSEEAKVYCNGVEIESEKSIVCYQKPQQFKVISSDGDVHTYTVCIYNSGLPVIYLTTKDKQSINDRETWLDQTQFTIYKADGTVEYDAEPELVQVKGRGNSTWDCAPKDKRPYAVKLNKKSRVMGMVEHKRWALLASYYDATLIHNAMTNYLAKKYTNQDWVPSGYNCELVLNDSHKGVYYICEQVKNSDTRVNAEYLMESDSKKGISSTSIEGPKSHNAFYTKDPELDRNSEEFANIKEIITNFETALYKADYDSLVKLIDLESFVDWYMLKELAHDVDGNMFTSCFFTIMKDGKMKMGPLWDFDLTYGTSPFDREFEGSKSYEGYYITTTNKNTRNATSWFGQFIKMPAFQQILKEKVLNLEAHLDDIFDYIDNQTEYLKLSATANKNTYSTGSGTMTEETYIEKMKDLKDFVQARLGWFVKEVSEF